MTDVVRPASELIVCQTKDCRIRDERRFEGAMLRLAQAQSLDLFPAPPQKVTLYLRDFSAEGELTDQATCKGFFQVRREAQHPAERGLWPFTLWIAETDPRQPAWGDAEGEVGDGKVRCGETRLTANAGRDADRPQHQSGAAQVVSYWQDANSPCVGMVDAEGAFDVR